ncbi:chromate transporter [Paenibacillus filicis]|uniref:Chromate transporter n=1 Tax=Paenibacillus gyeongsangnamensis TaxID=3388067 RepID=A0ABT4Q541_9BACL|nr:chromate transporter [Paenibacillus filicis]MCZ8511991.1 chromate transporter [Paenibacillus filicis]
MNLLKLFWGFFLANVLGYGGGPSSIPLIQEEVVNQYGWLTNAQFADVLAVSNALPGPIATKIAAFVGYQQAGWAGLIVTSLATIAPSAIGLIVLLKILDRFRKSSSVKGMTLLVQPVIAVMMITLTWELGHLSYLSIGIWHSLGISAVSLWAFTKGRIHPAFVIIAAFVYGSLFLSGLTI